MASSRTFSSSTVINNGSQQYPYPSHVNVASFVSIRLSGGTNYAGWQKQMMCLVVSHDMLGFIDGTLNCPLENGDSKEKAIESKYREWKRSDTLVKGWIFGSLSEDLRYKAVHIHTAHDLWKILNTIYGTPPAPTTTATRNQDTVEYIPLYRAILRGDLKTSQEIFNNNKDALTDKLNVDDECALHIAISTCENMHLVEYLLEEINPELLPTLVDYMQYNALHYAAISGNITAAKMVVEKNPDLLFIVDSHECLPIHRALLCYHKSTFQYLLAASKQHIELSRKDGYQSPFEGISGVHLIIAVINVGLFDLASKLIKEFPSIARTMDENNNVSALTAIASKQDAFFSGKRYNFYQRFVYSHVPIEKNDLEDADNIKDIKNQGTCNTKYRRSCFQSVIQSIYTKLWKVALLHVPHIKHLKEDKVKHNEALVLLKCICEEIGKLNTYADIFGHYSDAFSVSVIHDTHEAVETIIGYFPKAIYTINNGYNISQIAIINRCEKVYNFLVHRVVDKFVHSVGTGQTVDNFLHLAGHLAPIDKIDVVTGAAMQMQRELQWFQEVEKFVFHGEKEELNDNIMTPIMVFRKEHKELRKEGEEWMKKTADSYTITTALIITIAFAAAITVPGGNNEDTGSAIFDRKASFIIFVVSDAISLFSSTTALLFFLSILTARYREEDFLYRLPKRLILGITMLFLSMTSMMVAFSATLYLMFGEEMAWILIPVVALTCLPITSFVTLQFPLLFDLIHSTYGHGIFAKQSVITMKSS